MHYITSILEIKPYTITVIFDDKEKRKINFEPIIIDFPVLKRHDVFALARLDNYPTIKWDGLAHIKETDGSIVAAPLDFSPDALYLLSQKV